ncbi:TOBE domain-containing protein [Tomitella gaofuii]|uniref:TOBE domain-containing protein n=1 Tax=Tomitella gaofuii TaxID=2760083 RepID=UPI0015FD9507|nr:TOBE domain-containing protein [Tomitella gaofuii]
MSEYRVRHAADLLGVSTDTVRRLIDTGALPAASRSGGVTMIDGAALARHARAHAAAANDPSSVGRSARNRLVGLVTEVKTDGVMAQVEIQAGPHSVVSLISADSARELGLAPGVLAVAVVKSTNVIVETPTVLEDGPR